MSNFITFTKHDTTGVNLILDRKKVTEYVLNLDKIDFVTFDEQFGNGYGEKLPRLEINIAGAEIVLYRDDALALYKKITEVRKESRVQKQICEERRKLMINQTDYYEVIENCGAPFKIQHAAMALIEEWKVDNCEVAIIAAKPDEIILEAADEHENKLQVKVYLDEGNPRLLVSRG